jgi:hypothetical protein
LLLFKIIFGFRDKWELVELAPPVFKAQRRRPVMHDWQRRREVRPGKPSFRV